jgi:hypothetical protein
MTRDEVVEKMVLIAETNNLEAMQSASLPEDQIEQMMSQVRPQLEKIQGQIYDALVEDGVINA